MAFSFKSLSLPSNSFGKHLRSGSLALALAGTLAFGGPAFANPKYTAAELRALYGNVPSLIVAAAKFGNLKHVKFLMNYDPTASELKDAAIADLREDRGDVFDFLVPAGFPVNKKSSDNGETVFTINVGLGKIEIVKVLIDRDADVNARDDNGYTALVIASRSGKDNSHTEIVKVLIDAGTDVNARDNKGRTALMIASHESLTNVVGLLIDAGADVNAKDINGKTALMNASITGSTRLVKLLVDNGADVNIKNDDRKTALRNLWRTGLKEGIGENMERSVAAKGCARAKGCVSLPTGP